MLMCYDSDHDPVRMAVRMDSTWQVGARSAHLRSQPMQINSRAQTRAHKLVRTNPSTVPSRAAPRHRTWPHACRRCLASASSFPTRCPPPPPRPSPRTNRKRRVPSSCFLPCCAPRSAQAVGAQLRAGCGRATRSPTRRALSQGLVASARRHPARAAGVAPSRIAWPGVHVLADRAVLRLQVDAGMVAHIASEEELRSALDAAQRLWQAHLPRPPRDSLLAV